MLLVDDLAAGGTKNLRHTPRGLVTLLSIASVAQWVEHVNIRHIYFLNAASLVLIRYATFIIVKTFVFIFIKISPLCNSVSPFCLI